VDSIFELLGVRDNQEIDFGEWYATTHSRLNIFIFRVIASHEIRADFTLHCCLQAARHCDILSAGRDRDPAVLLLCAGQREG
jgi:hypothetical protein